MIFDFETQFPEVFREPGQIRRDHNDIGVERIDGLHIAVHGRPDQAIGSEQFTGRDRVKSGSTLRGQLVCLQPSHLLYNFRVTRAGLRRASSYG